MNAEPNLRSAWLDLPRVAGELVASGVIRRSPEDFFVDEQLCFSPDGAGEHLLLYLEKRGDNTEWVSQRIARLWDVPQRDIGYAGLKDRNAVTRQWFSLCLPGRPDPDPALLEAEGFKVLAMQRHSRKLRRGALLANRFRIVIRDLQGDHQALDEGIARLAREGMPNFFGEQRFGRNGSNLQGASRLFRDRRLRTSRHQRGLLLSAARSFLFNQVLAQRIQRGDWASHLPGDVMMLEGKNALFPAQDGDDALRQRLAELDIHPTGPLWGRGEPSVTGVAAELEMGVIDHYPEWRDGLVGLKLDYDRRALRVRVGELEAQWLGEDALEVRFSLPPGSFATVLLRELLEVREAPAPGHASQPPHEP